MVNYKLYKHQRIGVFVDVQNFYYSAKSAYNCKVNFSQILQDAVKERVLVRALAYVIKADVGSEKIFFDALDIMGYEVRAKNIQIFTGGAKKGDWDVGITMDCIALASKVDVIVLCSGDGDFVPLIDYLQKSAGCRVEVMAFGKSTSHKIREIADTFFDLGSKKYLIPYAKDKKQFDANKLVANATPYKKPGDKPRHGFQTHDKSKTEYKKVFPKAKSTSYEEVTAKEKVTPHAKVTPNEKVPTKAKTLPKTKPKKEKVVEKKPAAPPDLSKKSKTRKKTVKKRGTSTTKTKTL